MYKLARIAFVIVLLLILLMVGRAIEAQVSTFITGWPIVPTPVILAPVTLDSLDVVDTSGQPCGLFLHGDTVTIRYRMANPNPIPVRTHISATISRHPIVLSGNFVVLTQQQVPIWVQPGSHVLEVSTTIPSDALLGRYEVVLSHNDSGDTAQLQDVFFVI